jgi:hypothetical protein
VVLFASSREPSPLIIEGRAKSAKEACNTTHRSGRIPSALPPVLTTGVCEIVRCAATKALSERFSLEVISYFSKNVNSRENGRFSEKSASDGLMPLSSGPLAACYVLPSHVGKQFSLYLGFTECAG